MSEYVLVPARQSKHCRRCLPVVPTMGASSIRPGRQATSAADRILATGIQEAATAATTTTRAATLAVEAGVVSKPGCRREIAAKNVDDDCDRPILPPALRRLLRLAGVPFSPVFGWEYSDECNNLKDTFIFHNQKSSLSSNGTLHKHFNATLWKLMRFMFLFDTLRTTVSLLHVQKHTIYNILSHPFVHHIVKRYRTTITFYVDLKTSKMWYTCSFNDKNKVKRSISSSSAVPFIISRELQALTTVFKLAAITISVYNTDNLLCT